MDTSESWQPALQRMEVVPGLGFCSGTASPLWALRLGQAVPVRAAQGLPGHPAAYLPFLGLAAWA